MEFASLSFGRWSQEAGASNPAPPDGTSPDARIGGELRA